MGSILKNNQPYGGGGGSSTYITVNPETSNLPGTTLQEVLDALATGVQKTIEPANWVAAETGYKCEVSVPGLKGTELVEVALYDDGTVSADTKKAFDINITGITTGVDNLTLVADKAITDTFTLLIKVDSYSFAE